jgi:hypothetical protein
MQSSGIKSHTPKICPRCGAFYQDLISNTCPQCFAKLEMLDDADAAELIAEQESRSRDPEFVNLKRMDDERFQEQSFGACMVVVLLFLVTVIVCTLLVSVAVHRQEAREAQVAARAPAKASSYPGQKASPVVDRLLPMELDVLPRRGVNDDLVVPGTFYPIYHAAYDGGVDVYALPTDTPDDDHMQAVHLAVAFMSERASPPMPTREIKTHRAIYFIVAPSYDMNRVANAISTIGVH